VAPRKRATRRVRTLIGSCDLGTARINTSDLGPVCPTQGRYLGVQRASGEPVRWCLRPTVRWHTTLRGNMKIRLLGSAAVVVALLAAGCGSTTGVAEEREDVHRFTVSDDESTTERGGVLIDTGPLPHRRPLKAVAEWGERVGWKTIEHRGVLIDIPAAWERAEVDGCEFQFERWVVPASSPACEPDAAGVAFYGSDTFDPAFGPGVRREELNGTNALTWAGYVYAGDFAVYALNTDRGLVSRVLGSARSTQ